MAISGKHFINGQWAEGSTKFVSDPVSGPSYRFSNAEKHHVEEAAQAAEEAFAAYSQTTRSFRAQFLRTIAEEIDRRGDALTKIGAEETGLPEVRLIGERGRTTGQLCLFADHIEDGGYLDLRHDPALPERTPLPRPDLKLVQRPVGPVAVFGASNFPLAFSTAGGDTASALAAGCSVIVKGHPAHPGTGEVVVQAIEAAMAKCNAHPGVFSFLQGTGHELGAMLVTHPLVSAVGFTGSLAGGRALFDLCAKRPVPIPFFGELGSVNPVFLLPEAASNRAAKVAEGWAASLTQGAGQFCTNPGVFVALDNPFADQFISVATEILQSVNKQFMLTEAIANAYRSGVSAISGQPGVTAHLSPPFEAREAIPGLFSVKGEQWLQNPQLHHEVFGPAGIVVLASNFDQMIDIAQTLEGQLTCTLHMDDGDEEYARALLPVLERKAGRLVANGFPTGVEVCDAMVHGGPYPASTNFGATSVGTLAIRRFLRPVCFQDIPEDLLPVQ